MNPLKFYECRICHRIGTSKRSYFPAGGDNDTWECRNDRACDVRRSAHDRRASEERWNTAIDVLLNSRFVAGEEGCTTAFWAYVDGEISLTKLHRELL